MSRNNGNDIDLYGKRILEPLTETAKSLLAKLEHYENQELCSRCRMILRRSGKALNQPALKYYTKVVATSDGLPKASTDCALCLLFLSTLSELDTPIEYFVLYDYGSIALGLQSKGKRVSRKMLNLLDPEEQCFQGPSTEVSHLDVSTNSHASLSFAKRCLTACDKHHKSCFKQELGNRVLPTRLIDIGNDTNIQPLLVNSTDLDKNSRYLTLSHCWGGHVPIQLLESNVETMKHSIPLHELPQTFQDALHFTKNLGLRYLWIDSLCIIQDSEEDWQKESARMCFVYTNSYCNIAAGAENSSLGLFTSRNPSTLQPITVRMGGMKHRVINSDMWQQQVEEAPLNQRSWVLQERILSPRNLHFSNEIFWECNETTSSESLPAGLPFLIQFRADFKMKAMKGLKIQQDSPENKCSHTEAYQSWQHIIEKYSNSALTVESDKMVAIGGLAERLQSVLNDTYLAGIWGHQLVTQLLWYCRDDSFSAKPKVYIAPSWSWASVNDGICFWNLYHDPEAKSELLISLKSTKIEHETSNTFGQVKSGALCLYGKLFNITSVYKGAQHDYDLIWADCLVCAKLVCAFDDFYDQSKQKHMYGLSILFRHDDGKRQELFGLLLEPSVNVGQFRRVGMFSVNGESLETVKTGLQCFDCKAGDTGLEYIDDGKDGCKYLITLI